MYATPNQNYHPTVILAGGSYARCCRMKQIELTGALNRPSIKLIQLYKRERERERESEDSLALARYLGELDVGEI